MKKNSKNKILRGIVLIIFICIIIVIIRFSKASEIIDINMNVTDSIGVLSNEEYTIEAINDGEAGYYCTLPEVINSKYISKYIIERKVDETVITELQKETVITSKYDEILSNIIGNEVIDNSINLVENNDVTNNNFENQLKEIDNSVQNKISTNNENEVVDTSIKEFESSIQQIIKLPNEKLYFTKEEIADKLINIQVVYDMQKVGDTNLYNKLLEQNVITNENGIEDMYFSISGYMPAGAEAQITKMERENVEGNINNYLDEKTIYQIAYDIKLMVDGQEYEPKDFNQSIQIELKGLEEIDYKEKKYKVLHIEENNNIEEINNLTLDKDKLVFEATSFSTYAILLEESVVQLYNTSFLMTPSLSKWNGSVATSFRFGNGTVNNPYLITSEEELAFLSNSVNNGNSYENNYFLLVTNLDLDNLDWTPIGNEQNSFKGIFDGNGYTISNLKVTITAPSSYTDKVAGLFGSIGDGSSKTIIKNLQINNSSMDLDISGTLNTSVGIYVGTVTAIMYNNSQVVNVIVNNGIIRSTGANALNNRSRENQVFIGGLVGVIRNTLDSMTDPGTGYRGAVENSCSDVDITLNITGSMSYLAQTSMGGVVGAILGQPVWPENCLYVGAITSTGFIGPIFGYLRDTTGYNRTSYYATLWNGNDAGQLTMTSYYTNYTVNGSGFTASVINGTSTVRLSSSTYNIGSVQGVNKGRYTNDLDIMLSSFNQYVNDNNTENYFTWSKSADNTYYFTPLIQATVEPQTLEEYLILINGVEQTTGYTYNWYINGIYQNQVNSPRNVVEASFETEYEVEVLVRETTAVSFVRFVIPKLELHFEFQLNENSIIATLAGVGLPYVNIDDYNFQWYKEDIYGVGLTAIPNTDSLTLTMENMEFDTNYKLVGTNSRNVIFNVTGIYEPVTRNVIYVDYSNGNNNRDGLTPETAVRTMSTGVNKFSNTDEVYENILVVMGYYSNRGEVYNALNLSQNYTITGFFGGINYNASLEIYGDILLGNDRTFAYMTFETNASTRQLFIYARSNNLIMDEGIYMTGYNNSNINSYALYQTNIPDVHIVGGYLDYNLTSIPSGNNNNRIIIRSGTYSRIIAGTRNTGTNGTSHNIYGSEDNPLNTELVIDIKNSTTSANYDHDINMIVCGQTDGNIYANIVLNYISGKTGRILGGSIGTNREITGYSSNTFWGSTTMNIHGGEINELYGASLGRSRSDVYYYGKIALNVFGGNILQAIYGAGGGGVTGYHLNSSDPYKATGMDYVTDVTIKIFGGRVEGNIYGAGYGYSAYLDASTTAIDGGNLYGDSYIEISGGEIIGNIYGAGRGDARYSNRPNLAQMYGNTHITISGTPNITGQIYGAGDGVAGYAETAKLIGESNITTEKDMNMVIYGGGNNSHVLGNTNIRIGNYRHTANIYGGGNLGEIEGTTNIFVANGETENVYGGGNQAGVTNTNIEVSGGKVTSLYGGSNQSGTVTNSLVTLTGGTLTNVYGGNNLGGTTANTSVIINGGTINGEIYGGGNQALSTTSQVQILNSNNIIPAVYAGGKEASVDNANITARSANGINYIYGGGYSADITESHVNIESGIVNNVFGSSNTSGTVSNSNIIVTGGTLLNIFGGNNNGGNTVESYIEIAGGSITNVYGGNNINGQTTNSNITTTAGAVINVFGGNNAGGLTDISNVTISGGTIQNVYGGGNEAPINETNVNILSEVLNEVYGGGNLAQVNSNTNVNILDTAIVNGNVYGGGNEGEVFGNTYVNVKNARIRSSVYAGGNGNTAIINGNTNLIIEGTTTVIENNVFGGGNKAATGDVDNNTSASNVNIVGATINGNVYGAANTSVVYGSTNINLGYDSVNNLNLEKGNIEILGTVFGGGEANESGSEIYDFSFISVTRGINISIDGNGHERFEIEGSIFGSGNASSASGRSVIDIKNYGTIAAPKSNVSVQRANLVTLINSNLALDGAKDRTNEYSNTYFSISRVDELKLKNNSILYINYGTNLLKKLTSVGDVNGEEVKAQVTINNDDNTFNRNVDNRIYVLEGKNINIATNEQVTTYGEVLGMTFFGIFTNKNSPSTSTGLYHCSYENNDEIINAGTFSLNAYILGMHLAQHDTTVDGFYSNYNNEGYIRTDYIDVTPEEDVYYMWLVGERMDVTTFEITLTASKYATLGTYELNLTGFSEPNTKFTLSGFSAGLNQGISLLDSNEIAYIAPNEGIANTQFGLSMESGRKGWQTNNRTDFVTENGGTYTGTNMYIGDNSPTTPTLNFYLYHSKNITEQQNLGSVRIRLQVMTPIDDLTYDISYIDMNINMNTALYQNDFYEGAITTGKEFELFTTTETAITKESAFSTYFSLFIPEFSTSQYEIYRSGFKRVLISTDNYGVPYVLPRNTKITMIDLVTNQYYYYVVTADDVTNGKTIYPLAEFLEMGTNNKYYDETTLNNTYYNDELDLVSENLIFQVDMYESNVTSDMENYSLLIELKNNLDQTLIGVLGIQRDALNYSIYTNKQSEIVVTATMSKNTIYLGDKVDLQIQTDYVQGIVASRTVYDTYYFDKKMGIKLSIYDNNGNRLNSDSLLGIKFILDGQTYYPRIDGTIRICVADRVANILSRIKVDTSQNTRLATGQYVLKIESFGSPDGIYYGLVPSSLTEISFNIINMQYGLKATISDSNKILDNQTGQFIETNNNSMFLMLNYSSQLANPNLAISLYRKDYSTIYNMDYNLVDFAEYVNENLTATDRNYEYVISDSLIENFSAFYTFKENLVTGTYKVVVKLYDGNNYIGETFDYIIIQ